MALCLAKFKKYCYILILFIVLLGVEVNRRTKPETSVLNVVFQDQVHLRNARSRLARGRLPHHMPCPYPHMGPIHSNALCLDLLHWSAFHDLHLVEVVQLLRPLGNYKHIFEANIHSRHIFHLKKGCISLNIIYLEAHPYSCIITNPDCDGFQLHGRLRWRW